MVDDELRTETQQEEKHQNGDVEHGAIGDGEGRTEAQQGDKRRIKQDLRDVEQAEHQSGGGAVLRNGGVAAALLSHPQVEVAGRGGVDDIVGVNQHLGVLFGGHLVDKQVVVAYRGGIVRGKTFVSVKQLLTIRQILPDAHVWTSFQGRREVE